MNGPRGGRVGLRPDGAFLVTNNDPPELRFFGPQGALQRTLGRAGRTPSLFASTGKVAALMDSPYSVAT